MLYENKEVSLETGMIYNPQFVFYSFILLF